MDTSKSELRFLNDIKTKYYKYIAGFMATGLALLIFSVCNMLGNGKYIFTGPDSEHQYFPFIQYFLQVIKGNASFFFSWNNGLGQGMEGTLAYYSLSPLNLIYLLFSADKFLSATVIVFAIKVFLSAFIMQIFLSYFFRNNRIGTIVFSVCYSLCAYQIIYYFLVNLSDVVYLFPLIMFGITKLIRENKIKVLLISYIFLFGFNFYMGYIAGINSFILGLSYFLFTLNKRNKSENINRAVKYLISVVVSLMVSSFIWLPSIIQLIKYGERDYSDYNALISIDPILLINNLFNSQYQSLDGYIPYIFCGTVVLILVLLFFFNKSIKKRVKLYFGTLLILYICIMCISKLNYFMHAFDTTQMLGYRYSYVFSFIICMISCYEMVYIRNNKKKDFIYSALAIVLIYILSTFDYMIKYNDFNNNFKITVVILNFILISLYFIILFLVNCRKTSLFYLRILFFLLISFDLFSSYVYSIKQMNVFKREDTYNRQILLEHNSVDSIPESNENEFYRTQAIDLQVLNVGIQDDFNNISSFNTFSHGALFELFKNVGMEIAPHMNTSRGMNDVMRSLLGVKYYTNFEIEKNDGLRWFLRDEDNLGVDTYHAQYGIGSACWEQYDKNLSLGFMVSNDVGKIDFEQSPFENMNILLSDLCGITINCYSDVVPHIAYKNSTIVKAEDFIDYDIENKLENVKLDDCYVIFPIDNNQLNSYYKFNEDSIIDTDDENYAAYNSCVAFTFDDNDMPIYSYFTRDNGKRYQYTSDIYNLTVDESVSQYQFRPVQEMSEEYILKLGHNQKEQYELLLYLDALNDSYDYFNKYYFASFDEKEFNKAYNILSKNQLKITQFKDGYVAGNITSDESGTMFTSIPYSNGWKAFVDGAETPVRAILNGSFVGIDLEAGKHSVELNYTVPGLNIGVIISLLGIIGILLLIFIVNKSSNTDLNETVNK